MRRHQRRWLAITAAVVLTTGLTTACSSANSVNVQHDKAGGGSGGDKYKIAVVTHGAAGDAFYPVGDRFLLLNRGKSLGDFTKSEITLPELTRLMAGGGELEALVHELVREDDAGASALGAELLAGNQTPDRTTG